MVILGIVRGRKKSICIPRTFRDGGRFEKGGGASNILVPPPPVDIGLTDHAKSKGSMPPPGPPVSTVLQNGGAGLKILLCTWSCYLPHSGKV